MKYKEGDLLVVLWHDISSNDGWVAIEDAKTMEPLRPVSCGFLLEEDGEYIRLTNTYLPDSCNVLIIPKSNIDKIVKAKFKA